MTRRPQLRTCILVWLCHALSICALEYDFGDNVYHIAVDNTTGDVYVGGNNVVYHLTENFTLVDDTVLQTCLSTCQNQVKVLEIDYTFRRLLVCESYGDGQCQFLDLENTTKRESIEHKTHPNASKIEGNRSQSPIVEYVSCPSLVEVNTSRIVVASSNYDSTTKPVLSVREIWNISGDFEMRFVSLESKGEHTLLTKHYSGFDFDFLGSFCHAGECFFLTLQRVSLNDLTLVTRVGRLCSSSLFPYVEIPMDECTASRSDEKSEVYDRALAMSLGQVQIGRNVEPVVILIFGKASSSTPREVDKGKGFAVCTFPLSALRDAVNQTFGLCSFNESFVAIPDWWNGSGGPCPNDNIQDGMCSRSRKTVLQRKKGGYKLRYHVVIPANQDSGHVVSIFTHTAERNDKNASRQYVLDDRMTIYVAMSSGKVHTIFSQWTSSDEVQMTLLNNTLRTSVNSPVTSLRKDIAVTSQYYYLLSETKVIRRPLDYCLETDNCQTCLDQPGCGWCSDSNLCQLQAKCPDEACPPEIESFTPHSGPTEGGTALTVTGPKFTGDIIIYICKQICSCSIRSNQTKHVAHCTVPALTANTTEKSCNLTVALHVSGLVTTAKNMFYYRTPSISSLVPTRMLREEMGDIHVYGKHLDIGSSVSVTVGNESCVVQDRNSSHIRCQLSSPQIPATSEECYEVSVKIDNAELRFPDNQTFCRCMDPVITGISPEWTFIGGGVLIKIAGTNLDLVQNISLGITTDSLKSNSNSSDSGHCSQCPDGTCIVCCSPNLTGSVTSPQVDSIKGEMSFTMTSRDDRPVNYTAEIVQSVQLVPNPEFCFDGFEDDHVKIKGKNLPDKNWINVTINNIACKVMTSTPMSLTCKLAEVKATLAGTNESHNSRERRSPLSFWNFSEELQSRLCGNQDLDEPDGCVTENTRHLRITVRGRTFLSACLDFSETLSPPGRADEQIYIIAIGSGIGGFLILIIVALICVMYVRHRKREFQKRRYQAQNSGGSGGSLIPSPIGSAENTYISLAHLLNPAHDKKKKKDIHEKGLLIQRKHLTLGNVIGHGNFGCVFEGYLQRRSGVDGNDEEDMPQKVAVKTLLDPATHAIDLQGFINEALLMKDFDHEHVLGLLGLSEGDKGLPLVVLPFMPRGDLLTYVKDEKTDLTVGDVLQFLTDIAAGMEYLAGKKLVHRDLAARNCMLDEDLHVKVADFGLCRDVYEKGYYHSDNKKKLPIRWMAIESIEKGTYSSKSDVWSLGVVMWELTTRGITPYPGVEGWDILRYLVAGRRLDQPLMCPDPLYALMERCWNEKPIERPPFYEIKQNLQTFVRSLETPAATNALCLDTQITMPRCHRFRDDAAVIEKVLMGMHKLSNVPRNKSSRLSAPLPRGDKSPTGASQKKRPQVGSTCIVTEAEVMQAKPAQTKSEESLRNSESLEMKERQPQSKGTAYHLLEK